MLFFYIIEKAMINIYKKIYHTSIKFFVCVYSIDMPNLQQNNETEHINKEINLLQDELNENEKSQESISKWVNVNRKNMSKKRTNDKSFSNQKNIKYS